MSEGRACDKASGWVPSERVGVRAHVGVDVDVDAVNGGMRMRRTPNKEIADHQVPTRYVPSRYLLSAKTLLRTPTTYRI